MLEKEAAGGSLFLVQIVNCLLNPTKPEITELSKQCRHEGIDGPRCPNMTDLKVHEGIAGNGLS